MIQDWTASLIHLVFLSIVIYLWKSKSDLNFKIAAILILLACIWGLHWIFISLTKFGGLNFFIAVIATILLSGYVASFYLISGFLIKKFKLGPFNIASLVCLAEWAKSNFFGGFPWLNIGVLQIDSVFSFYAPYIGSFGVGFLATYFAALACHSRKLSLIVAIVICFIASFLNYWSNHIIKNGQVLNVALIQGSISQKIKFDPEHEKKSQKIHLNLLKSATEKSKDIDVFVLPETAFTRPWKELNPIIYREVEELLERNNSVMLTGIPQRINGNWTNSLIALKKTQYSNLDIFNTYDKYHLVPFGEFIPWGFKWFVDMMNIPLGNFKRGELPQRPIKINDQFIGVNICFEDLFGQEIAYIFSSKSKYENPSILLNISNLAWFGNTNALDYHLKASRMRSLETGRPMIRSTNTGITASIDHKGRILESLEPMKSDFLLTKVQGTKGQTIYNITTDYIILVLSSIVLLYTFITSNKNLYSRIIKKLDHK